MNPSAIVQKLLLACHPSVHAQVNWNTACLVPRSPTARGHADRRKRVLQLLPACAQPGATGRRNVMTALHLAQGGTQAHVDDPQAFEIRPGRFVLQSRVPWGQPPKPFLLRVFVDVDRSPAEIVTAYATSKIAKYWKEKI
ncbi:hypothetical protein [Nitrospira sp. M1]